MQQVIDENQLCSGCITHREKDFVNWREKWEDLSNKCEYILQGKRDRKYDCIIPLNADAEDYYIVELALKLNLRPLLLYVNNYFGTDLSWRNLHNLETYFDLDLITFNPNIVDYKEAVRSSLRKFNSIYWPYQALKTSYPVRLGIEMKIPIVLWGGMQATEQTGKFSHYDLVEMSAWSRVQHDLFCVDELEFFGSGVQVNEKNQYNYTYPPLREAKKITGIYLSNYVRWDPWKQNHDMTKYGFMTEDSIYSFDQYERAGSSVFYEIHDILRYEKHGYRKVRDHLSREIRHNRISKSKAHSLYNEYISKKVDVGSFFQWLGTSRTGVQLFCDRRLINSSHLIGGCVEKINPESAFINSFFTSGLQVTENFVTYYKGI
jgi:hypothetical protein